MVSIPYRMVVWSTGIGTRPVIADFMKQIGQTNRRALATYEWWRVEGLDSVYDLGDCATINQRKVMEDIAAIFSKADKNNTDRLSAKEFKVVGDVVQRYPQLEIYLERKQLKNIVDLLKKAQDTNKMHDEVIDLEKLKIALSEVDAQMKKFPATAQVAAQQGAYLVSWRTRYLVVSDWIRRFIFGRESSRI